MSDTNALLAESLTALERVGCQFDHCTGPTLTPIDMRTCFVCEITAKLTNALSGTAWKEWV